LSSGLCLRIFRPGPRFTNKTTAHINHGNQAGGAALDRWIVPVQAIKFMPQPFHASKQAHWDKLLTLLRSASTTRRTASTLHGDEESIGHNGSKKCGVTFLIDICRK
jgi:hypothetical protein